MTPSGAPILLLDQDCARWDQLLIRHGIAALYAALAHSRPVVELNRAAAISMAFCPAVGLKLVDALTTVPSLKNYHLLPSVRGDHLTKFGSNDEARVEFERAAALTAACAGGLQSMQEK